MNDDALDVAGTAKATSGGDRHHLIHRTPRAISLAQLGGPHRPSTATNDRRIMAEQECVELMRDYPASVTSALLAW